MIRKDDLQNNRLFSNLQNSRRKGIKPPQSPTNEDKDVARIGAYRNQDSTEKEVHRSHSKGITFPGWFCKKISSMFKKCPDRLITSITAKPYIIHKIIFHSICSKSFNKGIIICYLQPHESCQGPKIPLKGSKWHEGFNLLKKGF